MSVRILKGDLVIEVSGDDDLRSVLSALGMSPINAGQLTQTNAAAKRQTVDAEAEPQSPGTKLRRLFRTLNAAALVVVRALARTPAGQNDVQLRQMLRLDSNRKLAGILTGISKNAIKCGFDPRAVMAKQKVEGVDGSLYLYRLAPAFLEALQNTPGLLEADEQPGREDDE